MEVLLTVPSAPRPSVFERIAALFGRRTAAAIAEQSGGGNVDVWGNAQKNASYYVTGAGDVIPSPISADLPGSILKIRVLEDGGTLITSTVDGKLQSVEGHPSVVKLGADGKIMAATWHEGGHAQRAWGVEGPGYENIRTEPEFAINRPGM